MSKAIRNRLDRVTRRVEASSSANTAATAWTNYMRRRHCRGLIRVAASEGKRDRTAEKWLADNPEEPGERRLAISYQPPKDHIGYAERLRRAKERLV